MTQQQTITSQGFWRWIGFRRDLLDQPQGPSIRRPGVHLRLGESAPPSFVLKANGPIGMAAGQLNQPVAELFFAGIRDPG
jgi:hypothetical protein